MLVGDAVETAAHTVQDHVVPDGIRRVPLYTCLIENLRHDVSSLRQDGLRVASSVHREFFLGSEECDRV